MALPTTQAFIDKAQDELGLTFPAWLVNRLITENGGAIYACDDEWHLFSVLDNSDKKRLTRSAITIIRETQTARQIQSFPANGVAIADNGTGDLLILLTHDDKTLGDTVYLWSHEEDELEAVDVSLEW